MQPAISPWARNNLPILDDHRYAAIEVHRFARAGHNRDRRPAELNKHLGSRRASLYGLRYRRSEKCLRLTYDYCTRRENLTRNHHLRLPDATRLRNLLNNHNRVSMMKLRPSHNRWWLSGRKSERRLAGERHNHRLRKTGNHDRLVDRWNGRSNCDLKSDVLGRSGDRGVSYDSKHGQAR